MTQRIDITTAKQFKAVLKSCYAVYGYIAYSAHEGQYIRLTKDSVSASDIKLLADNTFNAFVINNELYIG
jgi:hypothetical protein